MARLGAILKAVAAASWRAQRSAGSVANNNFFLMSVLFLQRNGTAVYLLVGLLLLFPLSADPLHKVPKERFGLWPLTGRERRLLRMVAPWLSPATWLIAGFALAALRARVGFDVVLMVAGLCASGFLLSLVPAAGRGGALHFIPAPPGRWGQLVRKNLRQMLATLDVYVALILCVGGVALRLIGRDVPAEAGEGLALLVLLALSSYAQCLFGLDGPGGFVRYRLLPLRGWQILAAKDAAFLTVAVLLTAPLAPSAGLAGALLALAVGHWPAVLHPRGQVRWRFSSSASLGASLIQTVLMTAGAVAASRYGLLPLAGATAAWIASLTWFGWEFEKMGES